MLFNLKTENDGNNVVITALNYKMTIKTDENGEVDISVDKTKSETSDTVCIASENN